MKYIEHNSEYIDVSTQHINSSTMSDKKEHHIVKKLTYGTATLLLAITFLYLLFDKSENAALKFGLMGTTIGLTLDTFSLSNHHYLFPQLSESQMIAFTVWMSCAYALYLIIPTIVNNRRGLNKF